MDFRTLEISSPEFEFPGVRQLTLKSASTGSRVDVSVYIPEAGREQADLPVLMLLHGVYVSHWSWMMQGGVHQVLEGMIATGSSKPFVLVMPSDGLWGDGSGYVAHHGKDFERLMAIDIPLAVQQCIDQVSDQSTWCISGLSMGGYGALALGLKYPDKFKAISAHSPITAFDNFQPFVEEAWEKQSAGQFESIYSLLVSKGAATPLRFDCGKEDTLIKDNIVLHEQMDDMGIPHQFETLEGAHNWAYWHMAVEKTFAFCTRVIEGRFDG